MADFISNLTAISALALFGVGGFYYFYFFTSDKHQEKEKLRKALKMTIIISGVVFLVCMIVLLVLLATREKTPMEKYDDVMSGYNWGKNYYYDTNSHSVLKKPWKR